MEKKEPEYIEKLKISGLKVTNSRLEVLSVIAEANQPVSAEEIFHMLPKDKKNINLSTVYRTLAAFEENGIILKINISDDGKALYAYNDMKHRHYMICVNCKKILTITKCPLHSYEKEMERETGFSITGHNLYLYGYCRDCKKNMCEAGD